jgi:hypothetical protein
MEPMHFTARLVIEQNMSHMTAFSARPDSPIAPVRAPRSHALGRALRRVSTRTSTPSLATATAACN